MLADSGLFPYCPVPSSCTKGFPHPLGYMLGVGDMDGKEMLCGISLCQREHLLFFLQSLTVILWNRIYDNFSLSDEVQRGSVTFPHHTANRQQNLGLNQGLCEGTGSALCASLHSLPVWSIHRIRASPLTGNVKGNLSVKLEMLRTCSLKYLAQHKYGHSLGDPGLLPWNLGSSSK